MFLATLADRLGLVLTDPARGSIDITGFASIESASANHLAYLADRKLAALLHTSNAGAILCSAEDAAATDRPCLVSRSPAADFARASQLLTTRPRQAPGVHPTAIIAESATLGDDVRIGPFVVVGDRARIGHRVEIHERVSIYADCTVGDDTLVFAGAVIRDGTRLGARCIVHPNAVLGSDGFGYGRDMDGSYVKIEQIGVVVIEDDVEIGAGATVDRATFGETRVGRGTKIDNLVQIGHNTVVGENTILCAQVGLAGSTIVGRGVTLAGQVGVAGHLTVGDGAIATAQTGIPSNVEPGHMVSGYPAMDHRAWLKSSAVAPKLPDMQKRLRMLERRVADLEAGSTDAP